MAVTLGCKSLKTNQMHARLLEILQPTPLSSRVNPHPPGVLIIPIVWNVLVLGLILVAHRVGRVPLRLSPDRSDPGLIPARGPLLHVLPSNSHTVLSVSLYSKA